MRRPLLRLLVTGSAVLTLTGSSLAADLRGYLQESVAVRTANLDEQIFHRQTLHLELTHEPRRSFSLRMAGDIYRDDADFRTSGAEFHSRIREAYVRIRFEAFDLRVGRMQLGWGESDALVVSDQVSPFDLSYFIVPEYDEIRLGVDGATLDYYLDSGAEVQFIWLAHFTSPKFAELESPWSLLPAEQLGSLTLMAADRPAGKLRNSEFGLKISGHPVAADWSVGYLRSWDDRPALRLSTTTATPYHEMFDLFTAGLAWPIGGVMLRIDSAYEHGRHLGTDPTNEASLPTATAGYTTRESLWRSVLAVDLKPDVEWWQQADLSLQFDHEEIPSPHAGLAGAAETDLIMVRVSAAYLNDTVKPWVLAVQDVRGHNSWLQAKVDWSPIDHWLFTLEYDGFRGHAFNGTSGGTYGSLNSNDMISTTLRYSF